MRPTILISVAYPILSTVHLIPEPLPQAVYDTNDRNQPSPFTRSLRAVHSQVAWVTMSPSSNSYATPSLTRTDAQ